jgi:hypothetical protein
MEGIAVIIGMCCKVVMLNVTTEIWLKADETRLTLEEDVSRIETRFRAQNKRTFCLKTVSNP